MRHASRHRTTTAAWTLCLVNAGLLGAVLLAAPTPVRAQQAIQQQAQGVQMQAPEVTQANPSDVVQVTATGSSTARPDDMARSRDEAIEAARRDAVEQVTGVFITGESEMRNFDLVRDDVLSRSQGYIKSSKIIKEGAANGLYTVTIQAEVAKAAFMQQVNDSLAELYRRVGKPRLMMVIRGDPAGGNADSSVDSSIASRELRSILLPQGFTFVDPSVKSRAQLLELQAKGKDASADTLQALGQSTQAEIVLVGTVRTGTTRVMDRFQRVEAEMTLDALRTDTGQVLASQTASAAALHVSEDTARLQALQKVAQTLTPLLVQQITYQWIKERNEGTSISLTVKNTSFGDLVQLRKLLANQVRGVKKVTQRSYSQGTALLELTTKDSSDRVAESISETKFPNFTLDVVDVTPTSLVVTMHKQ